MTNILPPGTDTTTSTEWTEVQPCVGYYRQRKVWASDWDETGRVNCYCCTCTESHDRVNTDKHCRNHGFAGRRPCAVHNLPGDPDQDGTVPDAITNVNTTTWPPSKIPLWQTAGTQENLELLLAALSTWQCCGSPMSCAARCQASELDNILAYAYQSVNAVVKTGEGN